MAVLPDLKIKLDLDNAAYVMHVIRQIANPKETRTCKDRVQRLAVIHQLAAKALAGVKIESVHPEELVQAEVDLGD